MKFPFVLLACVVLASCDKPDVAPLRVKEQAGLQELPVEIYITALVNKSESIKTLEERRIDFHRAKSGNKEPGDFHTADEKESSVSEAETELAEADRKLQRCKDDFLKSSPEKESISIIQNFSSSLHANVENYIQELRNLNEQPSVLQRHRVDIAREKYYNLLLNAASIMGKGGTASALAALNSMEPPRPRY